MVLTAEVEAIAMSILNNKVPDRWLSSGDQPLASYVNDFCACFEWFAKWWRAAQAPTTYWLGAFFHTRAFLAAVKLNYARTQRMDVASITFDFSVMEEHEWVSSRSIDRIDDSILLFLFFQHFGDTARWRFYRSFAFGGSALEWHMHRRAIDPCIQWNHASHSFAGA